MAIESYMQPYFLNAAGALAFLSLIPFILIYLIRPKPKDKVISSLMFIFKSEGRIKQNSFFRYLLRNLLFLMQLLTILLLAAAIATPYINTTEGITTKNSVIVIDASASMQTQDNGKTRFDKAKDMARGVIGERTTIILAANNPEVLAKNTGRGEASRILKQIEPYETTTSLSDAVRFGGEQLDAEGKVTVFSDFIIDDEEELLVIKNLLQSQGIAVDFIDLGTEADNVGIVDLELGDTSKVIVKNYDDKERTITLKVGKSEQELKLEPNTALGATFVLPPGKTVLEIDSDDDFPIDDKAYISAPVEQKTYILMIGNRQNRYLKAALEANPKNKVVIAEPPLVADVRQDVVILDFSHKDLLLKETLREMQQNVRDGNTLIIMGQEDLDDINLGGMLPVEFEGFTNDSSQPIILPTPYTKDVEVGIVKGYFKAKALENTAEVFRFDEYCLLCTAKHGAGNVIFYGIDDEKSDFKTSPSYPIFWNSLVKEMTGRSSLDQLNFKTGTILGDLHLFNSGFDKLGNTDIAVNLLDDVESDVSRASSFEGSIGLAEAASSELTRPWPFDHILAIAALAIILLEFLYLKYRGDF
ncbi:MAG: BatA and WFA domain-containing protein [Nanoarchaeota archaeon]|nr:BatA and WFA domain-containing protein [Nanoarchaeota archaeon]